MDILNYSSLSIYNIAFTLSHEMATYILNKHLTTRFAQTCIVLSFIPLFSNQTRIFVCRTKIDSRSSFNPNDFPFLTQI